MPFTPEQIAELKLEFATLRGKRDDILAKYIQFQFEDQRAKEYAHHGFMRRVKTLCRCVENIFSVCPPERTNLLSMDETSDLAINLQSFVMNAFGCCDNLAWVWVFEKNIRNNGGREIKPTQIGIWPEYKLVFGSFSDDFKAYIESRVHWYELLKNFRHALAHRIPLYVSRSIFNEAEANRSAELDVAINSALRDRDFDMHDILTAEQDALGKVSPWMMHSFSEQSNQVIFLAQIIADFNTINELSEQFFNELNR